MVPRNVVGTRGILNLSDEISNNRLILNTNRVKKYIVTAIKIRTLDINKPNARPKGPIFKIATKYIFNTTPKIIVTEVILTFNLASPKFFKKDNYSSAHSKNEESG